MKRLIKADLSAALKYIFAMAFTFALVGMLGMVKVHAEETEDWVHYKGTMSASSDVNVRRGPGTDYDKITDSNNVIIQMSPQETFTVIDKATASNNKEWYKIEFTKGGEEYVGFIFSDFVTLDMENPITPTPIPTPTPSPVPTPTQAAEPTDAPAPTQPLKNENNTEKNDKGTILKTILIVIIVAIVLLVGLIVFRILSIRKNKNGNAASRKVDKLRKMNIDNGDSGRKLPQIKKTDSEVGNAVEVRQDVYYKKTYDYSNEGDAVRNAEKDGNDKRALREAIDKLQEHDIVYHTIYGEGEVFDNSDVKLLEVRFGNDMRFLKKDQLVSRRELIIADEDDQSVAKRRRRKTN